MKKMATTLCTITGLLLTGCASMNNGDTGTLAGGVIGGLVGSRFGGGAGQVAATGAGALVGAFIGSKIGDTMDAVDRSKLQNSLENTKTGQVSQWNNPDSGQRYEVKPYKTYYEGNMPCRKFVTTAWISGRKEVVEGRACRLPNGRWKMM